MKQPFGSSQLILLLKEVKAIRTFKPLLPFFQAYGKGDYEAIKKVVASDVQWHIPGHHKLAGTKQGVDELVAFFNKLGAAGFKAEPMDLCSQ